MPVLISSRRAQNARALVVSVLLLGLLALACGGGGGGTSTPATSATSGGEVESPQVVGEIALPGTGPFGARVTPDGKRLFVPLFGTYAPLEPGGTVAVIDTATDAVIAEIPVGERPEDVEFTPDGAYAFVTNSSSGSVTLIRVSSLSPVREVPLGFPDATYPYGVSVADGRAYVFTSGGDLDGSDENILVLDADPRSSTLGERVGAIRSAGLFTRGGLRLAGAELVTARGAAENDFEASPEIAVYDTVSGQRLASVPILQVPGGFHGIEDVAITPNGDYAYAPFFSFGVGGDEVFVVDLRRRALHDVVRLGTGDISTHGAAMRPDGLLVGVTSWNAGIVSWIYTPTNTVVYQSAVGANPNEIAFTPDGRKAYVTNQNSHTVSVIALPTSTTLATRLAGSGAASPEARADLTSRVWWLEAILPLGDSAEIASRLDSLVAATREWAERDELEIGAPKDLAAPGAALNGIAVREGGILAGSERVSW